MYQRFPVHYQTPRTKHKYIQTQTHDLKVKTRQQHKKKHDENTPKRIGKH